MYLSTAQLAPQGFSHKSNYRPDYNFVTVLGERSENQKYYFHILGTKNVYIEFHHLVVIEVFQVFQNNVDFVLSSPSCNMLYNNNIYTIYLTQ